MRLLLVQDDGESALWLEAVNRAQWKPNFPAGELKGTVGYSSDTVIQSWLDRVGQLCELSRLVAGSSEHHDEHSTELAPTTIHYLPMAMSALNRFVHASQHKEWVMWYQVSCACVSYIASPPFIFFVQDVGRNAMQCRSDASLCNKIEEWYCPITIYTYMHFNTLAWVKLRAIRGIGIGWFATQPSHLSGHRWNIGISA